MTGTVLLPIIAMMVLTFVVWVYMFAKRIPFLQAANIPNDELTPAKLAELSPPEVANPSDNFKNLFELPVLFYALCIVLHVTNAADMLHVISAWVFVVFRCLHSFIHCTFNNVMARFGMYLVASLALWFMMLRSALQLTLG